jgi:hypothetical protein
MPFVDVVGKTGATLPRHINGTVLKTGTINATILIKIVVDVAH